MTKKKRSYQKQKTHVRAQGLPLEMVLKSISKSGTKSQPNNQNNRKSQHMGFFLGEERFWPQNQKFAGNIKSIVDFQTVPTERLLDSRSERQPHKGGRGRGDEETEQMDPSAEASCMIKGWDPKRVCMQAARETHFAWSLTDTPTRYCKLGGPGDKTLWVLGIGEQK